MKVSDLAKLMGKTIEEVEEMLKKEDTINLNLNEGRQPKLQKENCIIQFV